MRIVIYLISFLLISNAFCSPDQFKANLRKKKGCVLTNESLVCNKTTKIKTTQKTIHITSVSKSLNNYDAWNEIINLFDSEVLLFVLSSEQLMKISKSLKSQPENDKRPVSICLDRRAYECFLAFQITLKNSVTEVIITSEVGKF